MKFVIASWVAPLIDALWKNKSAILKENRGNLFPEAEFINIQYIGVPPELLDQISPGVLEILPNLTLSYLVSRTKTEFAKQLTMALTREMVTIK